MHVIPELGALRQENQKLEARLICIVVQTPCAVLGDPVSKINAPYFS